MPLSVTLKEAYYFFRNHIAQLAMLTMPLIVLQVGVQHWIANELLNADIENPQFGWEHGAAMMALLIIFSILIAALTLYLEVRSRDVEVSPSLVLGKSLSFVPPLLLAGVFSGLAVLAPFVILAAFGPLAMLGMVISFYLFARLTFVNFMVVVEQLTPLEAIKASFAFSKPLVTKTLFIIMLYIPLSLVGGVFSQLFAQVGLPLQLVADCVFAFLGLFVNVALFRLYMVNRETNDQQNDSIDSEH